MGMDDVASNTTSCTLFRPFPTNVMGSAKAVSIDVSQLDNPSGYLTPRQA